MKLEALLFSTKIQKDILKSVVMIRAFWQKALFFFTENQIKIITFFGGLL